MNEVGHETVSAWVDNIKTIATAALAGWGAAAAWFRQYRISLEKQVAVAKETADAKFDTIRCEMSELVDHNTRQDQALLKLEIHQANNAEQLTHIRMATQDTNEQLRDLTDKFTEWLIQNRRRT